MKEQYLLRALAFAFLLTSGFASVQAQVKDEPVADVPVAAKTIIESGDTPIRIEKRRPTLNGQTSEDKIGVFFYNTTLKPIRAFAWVTDTGSGPKLAVSLYNKGHKPELILLGSVFSDQEDPQFTFDWVLFTDGSTWGPDDHGRSREILGYFRGFQTAAARAAELVGEPDSELVLTTLDGPWQTSWSIQLPLKTGRGEKEYFGKGYGNVISDLLNDREITELKLPKHLTDQLKKELKEMQKEIPQP